MVAILDEKSSPPPPEPGVCHLLMEKDRKERKPPCGTKMVRIGKEGEQGKDWVFVCPKCDLGYVKEHPEMILHG